MLAEFIEKLQTYPILVAETPDWAPFWADSSKLLPPRPLIPGPGLNAAVGDRLRAAAFAEVQAEAAFLWAADYFTNAPERLRRGWLALARDERKHRDWLLKRMKDLGVDIRERPVNDELWYSLVRCPTAEHFALFMAGAEERGKRAGERFHEKLAELDPETSRIFGQIAREERAHIELAYRFFPRSH